MTRKTSKWMFTVCLLLAFLMVGCQQAATPIAEEPIEPQPAQPTEEVEVPETNVEVVVEPTDEPAPEPTPTLGPPVSITWYFPMINPAGLTDLALIEEKANEIITQEINVILSLKPVELAEYNEKMNTMVAAGEEFDLVYTSWWTFHYFRQASMGAFTPIKGLLQEHAPTIYAELPDYVWKACTVEGEIYGVPHWENAAGPSGWVIQTELLETYDFDITTIQTYEDIEPLLAIVKANEPDLYPLVSSQNGFWSEVPTLLGMEQFHGIGSTMIGFYPQEDAIRPLNLYATPEYEDYVATMRDWWLKGYLNDDAPINANPAEILNGGLAATFVNRNMIVDTGFMGGKPVTNVKIGSGILHSNVVLAHQTGVSHTSKHPVEAVKLLELVRSNQELFQLLTYGIQDQHWQLNEDGMLVRLPESGYNTIFDWMFGNTIKHGYLTAGSDPTYKEKFAEALAIGVPSRILGFVFDPDPVSSELAQLAAIVGEYTPQLNTGAGDYTEILPRFLRELEAAGINNVLAEVEKQLADWQAGP